MHSQKNGGNKCMGICGAKAYLKDTHVPFRIMTSSSTKKLDKYTSQTNITFISSFAKLALKVTC